MKFKTEEFVSEFWLISSYWKPTGGHPRYRASDTPVVKEWRFSLREGFTGDGQAYFGKGKSGFSSREAAEEAAANCLI